MAVFARIDNGDRVFAREVTGTNLLDLSQWLHSVGYPLFAVTEEMVGMMVVADPSPRALTAEEFAAEFWTPDEFTIRRGTP